MAATSAVLLYGYKLTYEEVKKVGLARLKEIRNKIAREGSSVSIVCDDTCSTIIDKWYIGYALEESEQGFWTDDLNTIDEREESAINLVMDELFQKEFYPLSREGISCPMWFLFTKE